MSESGGKAMKVLTVLGTIGSIVAGVGGAILIWGAIKAKRAAAAAAK